MRVVSSIDFHNDTEKYLDLAETEQVLIQRGENVTFMLEKRIIQESDEDLEGTLTIEEFRDRAKEHIRSLYAGE